MGTNYNSVAIFGSLAFKLGDVSVSFRPATLKTNLGKTFIEKDIPLRNNKNTVLKMSGVLVGLSQTLGQSLATAIQNDRDTLVGLDDGYFHSYNDGKHNFDAVIQTSSLVFDDSASYEQGSPLKFSLVLIEW